MRLLRRLPQTNFKRTSNSSVNRVAVSPNTTPLTNVHHLVYSTDTLYDNNDQIYQKYVPLDSRPTMVFSVHSLHHVAKISDKYDLPYLSKGDHIQILSTYLRSIWNKTNTSFDRLPRRRRGIIHVVQLLHQKFRGASIKGITAQEALKRANINVKGLKPLTKRQVCRVSLTSPWSNRQSLLTLP